MATIVFEKGSGDMGSRIYYNGKGRFNIHAGGAEVGLFDDVDFLDLVWFFKEAFRDPKFIEEIKKIQGGIASGLRMRQILVPRGFLYNFDDVRQNDDSEGGDQFGNQDSYDVIAKWLTNERKTLVPEMRSKGPLAVAESLLKRYESYPLYGYIMEG